MKTPIVLDAEHMAHIKMLLSYRKDIPEDYGRALVAEVERCREALVKIRDHPELGAKLAAIAAKALEGKA